MNVVFMIAEPIFKSAFLTDAWAEFSRKRKGLKHRGRLTERCGLDDDPEWI